MGVTLQVVPAGSVDDSELAMLVAHLSSSSRVSQHQRNVFRLKGGSYAELLPGQFCYGQECCESTLLHSCMFSTTKLVHQHGCMENLLAHK